MAIVQKKVWPEYFQKIVDGSKKFELRLNDFDIKEGDELVLNEYDPATKSLTGRTLTRKVGYVGRWKIDDLTVFWPREDIDDKGLQIISLLD